MYLRPYLFVVLLGAVLSVTACRTSRPAREPLEPVPPAAALDRAPDRYRDQAFIFAGEIVSLLQAGDRTLIELELVAIDHRGRPFAPRRSSGRVFLRTGEPVAADEYLPGRGVTGVVRFVGLAQAAVDGDTATFPLLDLLEHRVVRSLSGRGRPRFQFGLGFGFGL
jgi:starvation-inducible outer membrane lipoprotein